MIGGAHFGALPESLLKIHRGENMRLNAAERGDWSTLPPQALPPGSEQGSISLPESVLH